MLSENILSDDAMASVSVEEIDDFLDFESSDKILEDDEPKGEKTPLERVAEDKGTGELKVEDKPEGDEPTEKTPPDPLSTTPEVEPPPEKSDMERLQEQNAALLKTIEQLSADNVGTPTAPAAPQPGEGEGKSLEDYLKGVDFDEVMESKENFTKFFLESMKIVQSQTQIETAKNLLANMPSVVGSEVQRHTSLAELRREFYESNSDLVAIKGYVSIVAQEVAKANPEWTVGQVLQKAAEVTRQNLNLPDPSIPSAQKMASPPPALPGARSTRTPTKKQSGLQAEIDEFLED